MSDEGQKKLCWQPLESNPNVLNQYIAKLGVKPNHQFFDIYGTDPELSAMVPKPCHAVIFLIPITENYKKYCETELSKPPNIGSDDSADLFFMKQTIGNACGTIGVLHAIANNTLSLKIEPDSPIDKFLKGCAKLTAEEKGKLLEADVDICNAHSVSAQEGQTEAMSAEKSLDLHFVALVNHKDVVFELDGRKPFPVPHCKTSDTKFLDDALGVCKGFMARDTEEHRFALIALSQAN